MAGNTTILGTPPFNLDMREHGIKNFFFKFILRLAYLKEQGNKGVLYGTKNPPKTLYRSPLKGKPHGGSEQKQVKKWTL